MNKELREATTKGKRRRRGGMVKDNKEGCEGVKRVPVGLVGWGGV